MPDPVGTVYKLALEASHSTGAPIVNLFWFQALTALHNASDLGNDFVTGLVVSTIPYWRNCNVPNVTLRSVVVDTYTIETPTIPSPTTVAGGLPVAGVQVVDVVGVGSLTGIITPAVLAQHAILRTAVAGRSFRGRLYFGPAPVYHDGAVDGWRWPADAVASFQSFLNNCFARYDNADPATKWAWGVWSRKLGGNLSGGTSVNRPPFHAAGFTPLVSATAYAGIRTQRRREAPRGV